MGSQLPATRYAQAERFLAQSVARLVRNLRPVPNWLAGDDDAFWYHREDDAGGSAVHVEPFTGRVTTGFSPPTPPAAPAHVVRSPDGRYDLCREGGDLAVVEVATGKRRALTADGEAGRAYGASPGSTLTAVTAARTGQPQPPVAVWSPDSTRVLTHLLDERAVAQLPLLQHVPPDGFRPRVLSSRVPLVGDPELATAQTLCIDVTSGAVSPVGEPLLVEFFSPLELGWVSWDAAGQRVWLLREDRGSRRLRLQRIDLREGSTTTVVDETADDYVEPSQLLPWSNWTKVVEDREVLWLSERDGWAHIYVYDARTGEQLRRLTEGPWTVQEVRSVDAERYVYFVAGGREAGIDPYYRMLYRTPLDGGPVELLTPEDGDHVVTLSPSSRCFVDTCSRVDDPAITRVRAADGKLLLDVERADVFALRQAGWKQPERLTVTAADGRTELFGALYFPSDFDPARRYPLIDNVYPGPQLIRTQKSFVVGDSDPHDWPGQWDAQALAEVGFVVLTLDGRGTPLRSRQFHHHSHGRLQAAGELDDHVAAISQLAADRPYLDPERVGVLGHSAGGYAAVRAMLTHPETFAAGVASSGVHDLRAYLAYWGEKYQGSADDPSYDRQANADLAHQLRGPLLLIHGDVDDNVHPASTLRLVAALIEANRDFELLLMPNQNHECYRHPYYIRRVWDHFVRHLLRSDPPGDYRIGAAPQL